jgi:hypothetical protein
MEEVVRVLHSRRLYNLHRTMSCAALRALFGSYVLDLAIRISMGHAHWNSSLELAASNKQRVECFLMNLEPSSAISSNDHGQSSHGSRNYTQ